MHSWQFTGVGEPLVHTELPVPVPGPEEVLIEVKAAGLCHTDVGILHDATWQARVGPLPLTLGHEVAGVVSALGADVVTRADGGHWAVGDRVGINPAGRTRPGLGQAGGYGPWCLAFPEDLVPMPEDLSFAHGALATDAGRAPYRAVIVRGGVGPGTRVGIIGLGGLGQTGARIAVLAGAEVYVAEVKESLWPMARELGAHAVAASITEFAEANLDVIVDFAGFGTTTAEAIETVHTFGTVVQVGMGRLTSTISTNALILKQVTLIGSRGGTVDDIAAVYEMLRTGDLAPAFTTIGFPEIPQALADLHAGHGVGRAIALY